MHYTSAEFTAAQNAKLICFDLDSTLTESKSPLENDMSDLLEHLLQQKKVVVISGASFTQFQKQFLDHLVCPEELFSNLYLIPTSGGSFYEYRDGWQCLYSKALSVENKADIFAAFEKAFTETNFQKPEHLYGELLEDRETQITFSALGSTAPLSEKTMWDPDHHKRSVLAEVLLRELPNFSIHLGGLSSIDVTLPGVDKATAVKYAIDYMRFSVDQTAYVGDALFPGGNDEVVKKLGIITLAVESVADTKELITALIVKV